jgi:hypothetical protein
LRRYNAGDEDDPMIIGGVNGARGIVQYSCFGGQKLEVKLEVGVLKMEKIRMVRRYRLNR